MDKFLDILREEFEKRMEKKTGWGKNEVLIEFDKASITALIKYATNKGIVID